MTDAEIASLRSTAHPLRLRILSLLTGTSMSAAELARELGTSHANASYHLRVLAVAGEVVEAGEEKIRGGVAKRYRHPWEALARDGGRPQGDRTAQVTAMTSELSHRFAIREKPTKMLLCDAAVWVSPDTWDAVIDLVQQAARLVHAEALPLRSAGALHINLTMAAFGLSDPADNPR